MALILSIIIIGSFSSAETFGYGKTENVPINYSLIPTVNNSEYFDGYSTSSLYTYYRGLLQTYFNNVYCELTGCNMTGDINLGFNSLYFNSTAKMYTDSVDLLIESLVEDSAYVQFKDFGLYSFDNNVDINGNLNMNNRDIDNIYNLTANGTIRFTNQSSFIMYDVGGESHLVDADLERLDQVRANTFTTPLNISTFYNSTGKYINITERDADRIAAIVNDGEYAISQRFNYSNKIIKLNNGTNSTPIMNYIYVAFSGDELDWFVSSTRPTVEHALVSKVLVGDPSSKPYLASLNEERSDTAIKLLERVNKLRGYLYVDGFDYNGTTTYINIGTGQYVDGIAESFTYSNVNSSDGFYLVLNNGSYVWYDSFLDIDQYSDGGSIGTNKYFNVIFGITPYNGATNMYAVVQREPSGQYTSVSEAWSDGENTINVYPNIDDIKRHFIPIARMIINEASGAQILPNGFYTEDYRGGIAGGTSGGGLTEVDPIWSAEKINYVPYVGATTNLNLGSYNLIANEITGSSSISSDTIYGQYIYDTVGSSYILMDTDDIQMMADTLFVNGDINTNNIKSTNINSTNIKSSSLNISSTIDHELIDSSGNLNFTNYNSDKDFIFNINDSGTIYDFLNIKGDRVLEINGGSRSYGSTNPIIKATGTATGIGVIASVMDFQFTHNSTQSYALVQNNQISKVGDFSSGPGGIEAVRNTLDGNSAIANGQSAYIYGNNNIFDEGLLVNDSGTATLIGERTTMPSTIHTSGDGTYKKYGTYLFGQGGFAIAGNVNYESYGIYLTGWGSGMGEFGGTVTNNVGAIYSNGGDWINDADNSKIRFGDTQGDFDIYFDGTNAIYNTSGGLHYFDGGNLSVLGINYRTPESKNYTFDDIVDPKKLKKDNKTEEEFHNSFPDKIKTIVQIKDEDNCWQEPDRYCFNVTEKMINKSSKSDNLLFIDCFEDLDKKDKFFNNAKYETIYKNVCGKKNETQIDAGDAWMMNYELIIKLKEENDLLKSELCNKDNSYSWCLR